MKIKLLIVEDEINVNQSLSEFMRELGSPYELIGSVTNGKEALDQLNKEQVHIVFTDIRMPKMDGLELIEHIYKMDPAIKVIILSGYTDFNYAQRAMKFGVVDYLLKPFKKEELLSILIKTASNLYIDTNIYSSLLVNQERWSISLVRIESELFDQVEMGNIASSRKLICNLLEAFRVKVDDDILRIIPYIADSLVALNKRLAIFDNIYDFLHKQWSDLKTKLVPQNSFQEIEEFVIRYIVQCAMTVKSFREQSCPDVFHRCKEMINDHYDKDISLNELAHMSGITVSYLSRLFKKEFGKNYTYYLNEIRINKAKELLNNPNMKIMEVASRVGYHKANYFTKIFKKYTGKTPQEYREKDVSRQ